MDTIKNVNFVDSIPKIKEENYTTLDRLDLTDIAQAIDGSRSKITDAAEIDEDPNNKRSNFNGLYKTIKCWFW